MNLLQNLILPLKTESAILEQKCHDVIFSGI
jgi:hypothetical protein